MAEPKSFLWEPTTNLYRISKQHKTQEEEESSYHYHLYLKYYEEFFLYVMFPYLYFLDVKEYYVVVYYLLYDL